MSRLPAQQGLQPSLIDRLIDPGSGGTAWRPGYGLEQMSDAVRRDLEELLNTRQTHAEMPDEFDELRGSVLAYGLPDLTSLDAFTPGQREEIGHLLARVVERFEPRLRDIKTHMVSGADSKDRTIRFRIEAKLAVDPAPAVAFETILELTSGHYSVKHST
jgi:type VI secretion system protein ImpF